MKESMDVLPMGSNDYFTTMGDEYKPTTGHLAINLAIGSWLLIYQKIVLPSCTDILTKS